MRSATRENLLKVARIESFTGTGAASRAWDLMDDSPATARPVSFDPGVVSAEGLVELFEGLGLFSAEGIIAWRRTNDGAFPDADTLASTLGLDGALATRIAEAAVRHERAEDATAAVSEASLARLHDVHDELLRGSLRGGDPLDELRRIHQGRVDHAAHSRHLRAAAG